MTISRLGCAKSARGGYDRWLGAVSPFPLQVSASLTDRRYERWRWVTFAITWLIYAGFYFTRQSFGVAKAAIEQAPNIGLTRAQQGDVDSAYGTTYMLGQFLFGALGDRFGPKRILLAGM